MTDMTAMTARASRHRLRCASRDCDLHRLMDGATKLKCSEFGEAIIKHMSGGAAGAGKKEPAMARA